MSDCEFNIELGAYYDDHLTPERRTAFERHLPDCLPCTEELRAFRNLSRLLATQPTLFLSDHARRRLYFAARNAAVPGILRLVKTLTAAAAAILVFASFQLIWTHPVSAPTPAMPAAWEQAAMVGDLPTDATADASSDRGDLRFASWIDDDLSQRGRRGQN